MGGVESVGWGGGVEEVVSERIDGVGYLGNVSAFAHTITLFSGKDGVL